VISAAVGIGIASHSLSPLHPVSASVSSNAPESSSPKKQRKVFQKKLTQSPIANPSRDSPIKAQLVKRANKDKVLNITPAKKPKKLVEARTSKVQFIPVSVPISIPSLPPTPASRVPLEQEKHLVPGGKGPVTVTPLKIPIKPKIGADRKTISTLQVKKSTPLPRKTITTQKIVVPKKLAVSAQVLLHADAPPLAMSPQKKTLLKDTQEVGKPGVQIQTKSSTTTFVHAVVPTGSTAVPLKISCNVAQLKKGDVDAPSNSPGHSSGAISSDTAPIQKGNISTTLPEETKAPIKNELEMELMSAVSVSSPYLDLPPKAEGVSEKVSTEEPVLGEKPSVASEEESCHSLLCEEEIPGSPPAAGADSNRFGFEDETARQHSPREHEKEDGKPSTPHKYQTSFSDVKERSGGISVSKTAEEKEEIPKMKHVAEIQTKEPSSSSSDRNISPPKLHEPEYAKESAVQSENPSDATSYHPPPDAIDNTPPTTPESSSVSSGSPRG
jgi:hypothetical protein